MKKNNIEEEGTHEELLAHKGLYYRLWNGLTANETDHTVYLEQAMGIS